MKTNNMILLDQKALQEVNGGSEATYKSGQRFGEALRKALAVIDIFSLFI